MCNNLHPSILSITYRPEGLSYNSYGSSPSLRKINIYILYFLFASFPLFAQVKQGKTKLAGGNPLGVISINHVPVVVPDIEKIKPLLSSLGFTIKNGRIHAGINNCFIKFPDGSYLEFVQPLDTAATIGKFYYRFLKNRAGATEMAIDVHSADSITGYFTKRNIPFNTDSNSIWTSISPKQDELGLFFIEYAVKNAVDVKQYTTHVNTATGLATVYFVADDIIRSVKHFTEFGFSPKKSSRFLDGYSNELCTAKNKLVLFDSNQRNKMTAAFISRHYRGICGFSIRVLSLKKIKKQLFHNTDAAISFTANAHSLYVSLKNYNLFFEFTE